MHRGDGTVEESRTGGKRNHDGDTISSQSRASTPLVSESSSSTPHNEQFTSNHQQSYGPSRNMSETSSSALNQSPFPRSRHTPNATQPPVYVHLPAPSVNRPLRALLPTPDHSPHLFPVLPHQKNNETTEQSSVASSIIDVEWYCLFVCIIKVHEQSVVVRLQHPDGEEEKAYLRIKYNYTGPINGTFEVQKKDLQSNDHRALIRSKCSCLNYLMRGDVLIVNEVIVITSLGHPASIRIRSASTFKLTPRHEGIGVLQPIQERSLMILWTNLEPYSVTVEGEEVVEVDDVDRSDQSGPEERKVPTNVDGQTDVLITRYFQRFLKNTERGTLYQYQVAERVESEDNDHSVMAYTLLHLTKVDVTKYLKPEKLTGRVDKRMEQFVEIERSVLNIEQADMNNDALTHGISCPLKPVYFDQDGPAQLVLRVPISSEQRLKLRPSEDRKVTVTLFTAKERQYAFQCAYGTVATTNDKIEISVVFPMAAALTISAHRLARSCVRVSIVQTVNIRQDLMATRVFGHFQRIASKLSVHPSMMRIVKPIIGIKNAARSDVKPQLTPAMETAQIRIEYDLTDQQREVLTRTKEQDPWVVVHGPAGCGKTATLLQALKTIMNCYPDAKILITCPGNQAASSLFKKIVEDGDLQRFPALRHYSRLREGRVEDEVTSWEVALNPKGRISEDYERSIKQYHAHVLSLHVPWNSDEQPAAQLMKRLNVVKQMNGCRSEIFEHMMGYFRPRMIITTCACAAEDRISSFKCSHAVVDEAGQASCAEVLQTMSHFVTDEHSDFPPVQALLFGDPQQLCPIVRSRGEAGLVLKTSILQRVMESGAATTSAVLINFRSNPWITMLASELFYDGKLKSAYDTATTEQAGVMKRFPWPSSTYPVNFFDVDGAETGSTSGHEVVNHSEIDVCKRLCQQLVRVFEPRHMAVLSFYAAHKHALASAFSNDELAPICVTTADAFQGQERDIVIITCARVRSAGERTIGFLSDQKRLCMAITRASKTLVVVGLADTLKVDQTFSTIIEHCRAHSTFVKPSWLNQLAMRVSIRECALP